MNYSHFSGLLAYVLLLYESNIAASGSLNVRPLDPQARNSVHNASGNIPGSSPERTPGSVPRAAPGKSRTQGVPGSDAENALHQKIIQRMTGGGDPIAVSIGLKLRAFGSCARACLFFIPTET